MENNQPKKMWGNGGAGDGKGIYEQMKASQTSYKKLDLKDLSDWIKSMHEEDKKRRKTEDPRQVLMAFDDYPHFSDKEFIELTKNYRFMGGLEAYEKLIARAKRLNLLPDNKK
jgi:hypothetical protein